MLDKDTGKFLVKYAREVIENYTVGKGIKTSGKYPEILNEKRGVFVTLERNGELRGCIGIAEGKYPLIKAVKEVSKSVCNDPRFPPLSEGELNEVTVEVSVLTKPDKIKMKRGKEILNKIEKGKDGLILENRNNTGLFLPQVWKKVPDKEDFLGQLCFKAGLSDPTAWLSEDSNLYKFQVQAFKESKPKGEIEEE